MNRFKQWMPLIAMAMMATAAARAAVPGGDTLYARLGGYDAIQEYVALVFPRVAAHPELHNLFVGHGNDSQQRQFQMVVELVCKSTGGPCIYTGRPMPAVHTGLNITERNWTTFMKIISDGMDEKKYPSDVKAEFLRVWENFRPGVVDEPSSAISH